MVIEQINGLVFFSFACLTLSFLALRWMDGSPVIYQMWDEGQPDCVNSDEYCAVMRSFHGE